MGGFQLAYVYDFINAWLTPDQRQAMHDELAAGSWSHDNYGTFNTAETSRSNWATFSYWLYETLAIEGEPGFNDLKVRGMYRGWRNLLTYGWFQSGATFEGEAKNQLGMDGIIPFAMRRQKAYGFEDLCGHPYLRAYADHFLPHSLNPMLTGFHKYDLLGGSRNKGGGFTPMDMVGLKYMFPQDRTIDWVYRKTIGEDYANLPDRPDGYFNGLLFTAIFASDFDPANNDPDRLGLGHTFFCPERALLMTRSGWNPTPPCSICTPARPTAATPFADRNAIMVAGAGRVWSPNGYASFTTAENSVVCIDGQSQDLGTPGRMVDFQDRPEATFAVGDASYCWDWKWSRLDRNKGYYTIDDVKAGKVDLPKGAEPEKHSVDDFSMLKLPYSYLKNPAFEMAHWIKPKGALQPAVRAAVVPRATGLPHRRSGARREAVHAGGRRHPEGCATAPLRLDAGARTRHPDRAHRQEKRPRNGHRAHRFRPRPGPTESEGVLCPPRWPWARRSRTANPCCSCASSTAARTPPDPPLSRRSWSCPIRRKSCPTAPTNMDPCGGCSFPATRRTRNSRCSCTPIVREDTLPSTAWDAARTTVTVDTGADPGHGRFRRRQSRQDQRDDHTRRQGNRRLEASNRTVALRRYLLDDP